MGLFYKYKCKRCGKRYFELPVTCENCGTELSFLCPASMWLIEPVYKRSKNCEEIHEFAFALWKSRKIREFEEKIRGLNVLLESKQDEIEELQKRKHEVDKELIESVREKRLLNKENIDLRMKIFQLNQKIMMSHCDKPQISNDVIQAVKYAMKKSHPDNGGNAEDFMRFQKVYEELTGRGG